MRIIEIMKDEEVEEYPDGFTIVECGCGCCENNHNSDFITIEDLNQFANWLETQRGYEQILRRKLIVKGSEKE